MVEIYALIDPFTNEIRYIGKANDAQKRLKTHMYDSKRRNTNLYMWIKELKCKPALKVLKTVNNEEWESEEIKTIAYYKSIGCVLLNMAKGGNEPYCSIEVRKRNAVTATSKRNHKLWRLKNMLIQNMKIMEKYGISTDHIKQKLIAHNISI